MNIYLLQEDGESFCIQAETMAEAIRCAESISIQENWKTELKQGGMSLSEAINWYHTQILQSCSLIGELKNPDRDPDEEVESFRNILIESSNRICAALYRGD